MTWIERGLSALAITWAAGVFWPASFWYDAGQLRIPDFVEGADFELFFEGGAVRRFSGQYSVVMRDTSTRGIVAEMGSARFDYEPGAARPDPLLISWWAANDPRFLEQPPGAYLLETCWTIHGIFWGLVPAKKACSDSNIFKISPEEG